MTGLSADHLGTLWLTLLTFINSLSFPVNDDLVILSFSLKGVSIKKKVMSFISREFEYCNDARPGS